MRKVKEILRQKWVLGRSHREVAQSAGVSLGTVSAAVTRAQATGLTEWVAVEGMAEAELEERLYGPKTVGAEDRPVPDCAWIHIERKRPGVTLELLHLEYLEKHPDGYRYTQFCEYYRQWAKRRRVTMRQVHRAGEKLFVDYAGMRPVIVDPGTGEIAEVELFVAVLGASNYTYAEATRTQQGPDFIASQTRAVEYFGGVTALVVPDQLRPGVKTPCRYEPEVQWTYEEWARHYGTAVLPARPGHPRDKAKVEAGVLVAERWILARLRNETFHSLGALNSRIAELRENLNGRRMRLYGVSRRELFERLDRPALRSLPAERFVYAQWKTARVNIDYHVVLENHFYSVPFALVHEQVETRLTASTVEIFHRGQRVASHLRSHARGQHTTVSEHMPKAHQKHAEWTPTRLVHWAESVGPETAALVAAILAERPHPEQGYRSCLGILRLERRYGKERLEAAAARGLRFRARSYRNLDSILRRGLDRLPLPEKPEPELPLVLDHENIRGGDYYR